MRAGFAARAAKIRPSPARSRTPQALTSLRACSCSRGGEHYFRPRRYHGKRQLRLIRSPPSTLPQPPYIAALAANITAPLMPSAPPTTGQRAVSAFVAALAARSKQARKLLRGGLQAVEIFAAVGAGEHNDFPWQIWLQCFQTASWGLLAIHTASKLLRAKSALAKRKAQQDWLVNRRLARQAV